ncbi:MAG TPA: NlpC/P60 family protein, partial [Thermosynechococcaceae cyanobacterium]
PTISHPTELALQAYLDQQENILKMQLDIERQKLKVAAKVAKTDYQRATVEAYGDTVKAEDRWNLIALGYGWLVLLIYVIPPFSGALQAAWKAPGTANLVINQATEKGSEAIAPALSNPPTVGEKINGYEVKAVNGNTVTIALNDGLLYPIGKEPVDVKCQGEKLTYAVGAVQFAYEPLNNCAGDKQQIGQAIGKSKNVSGIQNTIKITRSDKVPTQADLWQALTGSAPEPALNRVEVTSRGKQISEKALAWAGKPFSPGVQAQCAMFVRQVLKDAGANAGVTQKAIDGLGSGEALANSFFGEDVGQIIPDIASLQPGDLIAFGGTYGGYPKTTITHVAVYVGNGEMVDRGTTDRDVTRRSITTFPHFVAGVRLK